MNIIITGSTGNFGSFLVFQFSQIVHRVVAIDKNVPKDPLPEGVSFYQCDLTNHEEVSNTVNKIYLDISEINVVINNAGIIFNSPLINLMDKNNLIHNPVKWNQVLDTNLNTTFNFTSIIAYQMIKRKNKGVIINVSSVAALGNTGQSAYSAAKAAINALTVTWSKELSMFGIRTNSIAPGFFETQSTREALDDKIIERWRKEVPLRRLGKPIELFHALKFIIENDYYNGQVLELNGGLRI